MSCVDDYLEQKQRRICENWKREDTASLSERDDADSVAMFRRRTPPRVHTTGSRIEPRAPRSTPPESEDAYQHPPVVLPDNPSPGFKAWLDIDVRERLMTPRRLPPAPEPKKRFIQGGAWESFQMRDADFRKAHKDRDKVPQNSAPATTGGKVGEVFDRLFTKSVVLEVDDPGGSSWTPATERIERLKSETLDPEALRSLRFSARSQEIMQQETSSFEQRNTRAWVDARPGAQRRDRALARETPDPAELRLLRFGTQSQMMAEKETRPFKKRHKQNFAQVIQKYRSEQQALRASQEYAAGVEANSD
jgi:hypothetical protein